MKRKYSIHTDNLECVELLKIEEAEMNKLLYEDNTRNVVGISIYYDDRGIIWPLPHKDWIIATED